MRNFTIFLIDAMTGLPRKYVRFRNGRRSEREQVFRAPLQLGNSGHDPGNDLGIDVVRLGRLRSHLFATSWLVTPR